MPIIMLSSAGLSPSSFLPTPKPPKLETEKSTSKHETSSKPKLSDAIVNGSSQTWTEDGLNRVTCYYGVQHKSVIEQQLTFLKPFALYHDADIADQPLSAVCRTNDGRFVHLPVLSTADSGADIDRPQYYIPCALDANDKPPFFNSLPSLVRYFRTYCCLTSMSSFHEICASEQSSSTNIGLENGNWI